MFTHVQSVQANGTGTTATITIASAALNNLLVIHAKLGGLRTLSVTDNASTPNTYALAGGPVGSNGTYMHYGVQITGGATTITITWTTSISWRITVEEFSGGATTNAAVIGTVTTTSGTGTAAALKLPVSGPERLISAGYLLNATSGVTAGANYTLGINNISQSTAYRLTGNTNFETAPISWTGSAAWAAIAASFLPANPQYTFGNFFRFM